MLIFCFNSSVDTSSYSRDIDNLHRRRIVVASKGSTIEVLQLPGVPSSLAQPSQTNLSYLNLIVGTISDSPTGTRYELKRPHIAIHTPTHSRF